MDPVRHLRFSLFSLLVVFTAGTIGYAIIEGWSLFDSLYMTVITLSTVGFQEVAPLSQSGRAFTILLIVFGAGIIAYAIGSMIQIIVEGQVLKVLGRKKLQKQIARLSGHYIICGYGRIGAMIAREFAARPKSFVIVENDPGVCERLSAEGHLFVRGNATDDDTLLQAGIERARGLITAVTSDTENVYITLTARGLKPELFILARAGEENSEVKLIRAGANKVVSPYTIGATRMAQAILRPSVVDFIEIATGTQSVELQLEEILIATTSELGGKTLITSGIRKQIGVIIVGIKRGSGMLFNPAPETTMQHGDILITLGDPTAIRQLEILAGASVVS